MKEQPTYCFIVNGASNSQKASRVFKTFEQEIWKWFPEAEIQYVQKDDSIEEIASNMAMHFSHIIACGGDGTVNLVANGIMDTDAILGILPIGSGNDFSREIGCSGNIYKDLRRLLAGTIKSVDVVQHNHGYFLNTMGIGVDGLTNYYATKSRFKRGGMRYFSGGLKALLKANPFKVSLKLENQEEKTMDVWMVTVANGSTEGGRYKISPESNILDGKLEMVVVKKISRIRLLYEFIKLSMGLPFNKNIIQSFSIHSRASISPATAVKVHADGEQIVPQETYSISFLKSKMPVIFVH